MKVRGMCAESLALWIWEPESCRGECEYTVNEAAPSGTHRPTFTMSFLMWPIRRLKLLSEPEIILLLMIKQTYDYLVYSSPFLQTVLLLRPVLPSGQTLVIRPWTFGSFWSGPNTFDLLMLYPIS